MTRARSSAPRRGAVGEEFAQGLLQVAAHVAAQAATAEQDRQIAARPQQRVIDADLAILVDDYRGVRTLGLVVNPLRIPSHGPHAIVKRCSIQGQRRRCRRSLTGGPASQAADESLISRMIRLAILSAALILLSLECARSAEVGRPNSCPRPSDQHGPRYEIMTGAFQSRGVTPGGGKYLTIMGMDRAAPISVNVTGEVFDVAGTLAVGTRITLVGYVSSSMSGAQPAYSCIELAL